MYRSTSSPYIRSLLIVLPHSRVSTLAWLYVAMFVCRHVLGIKKGRLAYVPGLNNKWDTYICQLKPMTDVASKWSFLSATSSLQGPASNSCKAVPLMKPVTYYVRAMRHRQCVLMQCGTRDDNFYEKKYSSRNV